MFFKRFRQFENENIIFLKVKNLGFFGVDQEVVGTVFFRHEIAVHRKIGGISQADVAFQRPATDDDNNSHEQIFLFYRKETNGFLRIILQYEIKENSITDVENAAVDETDRINICAISDKAKFDKKAGQYENKVNPECFNGAFLHFKRAEIEHASQNHKCGKSAERCKNRERKIKMKREE